MYHWKVACPALSRLLVLRPSHLWILRLSHLLVLRLAHLWLLVLCPSLLLFPLRVQSCKKVDGLARDARAEPSDGRLRLQSTTAQIYRAIDGSLWVELMAEPHLDGQSLGISLCFRDSEGKFACCGWV